MPIPWLTVLQSLPWGEVIKTAPKVADAAKSLWKNTARRRESAAAGAGGVAVPGSAQEAPANLAELLQRQAELRASLTELQGQMLESSELIKALADQNNRLIEHLAAHERRARAWGAVTLLLALGLIGLWWKVAG